MFAELVINIEAPLENTFHYAVPFDLEDTLQIGHLVEVEFGRRLAQGIVVAFSEEAPVADTKPVIALVDELPVVTPSQIKLAQWMADTYLTALNACLRLMLPPGLTRWSDITVAIRREHRYDDFEKVRLTETQAQLITLLREKGDMRGRQIRRALPKGSKWENAVNQLHRRGILDKASVLDPPRVRPKQIKTAELIGTPRQIRLSLPALGRKNKQADLLYALLQSDDPLPKLAEVLTVSGADEKHLQVLEKDGWVRRQEAERLIIPAGPPPKTDNTDWQATFRQLPAPAHQLDEAVVAELLAARLVQELGEPTTLSLAQPVTPTLHKIYALRGATAYQRIIELLAREARPLSVSDIYGATDTNINHLRKLVKLDLVRLGSEEIWRDPLADRDFTPADAPRLTADQARVWGRLKVMMLMLDDDDEPNLPILLHGVTGSGKTEIYMRAIQHALDEGRQAVVLVPEIALTPQTVRRFAARFPGRVAVLHSRLTDGERYDTWRRARDGQIDIMIGPRSALFSPLPDVGIIVLDEEHDPSYKQTPPVPPPYYHTRAVAAALAQLNQGIVVLGSATPDIVTYHRARSGRYHLLELPKRVMGHRLRINSQAERLGLTTAYENSAEDPDESLTIPLPPIQIVDLRQELRAGNRSIFSRDLQTALDETLERGEQAILFLNRRGTNTFVICRDCGHTLTCPRCDTPLTYHRNRYQLTCHQCNYREAPSNDCPQCGSKRIRYFGLGTEELEAQVRSRWPEARIVRWDRDTTAGRDSHEQLLASFVNQEADILVGTQMIAKGLDLPLVTLVGVISADVSLGLPDYRTGERAFPGVGAGGRTCRARPPGWPGH